MQRLKLMYARNRLINYTHCQNQAVLSACGLEIHIKDIQQTINTSPTEDMAGARVVNSKATRVFVILLYGAVWQTQRLHRGLAKIGVYLK